MNDLKYLYLYSPQGEITFIDDAIKGVLYYKLNEPNVEYIVRDGGVNRKHYSIKSNFSIANVTAEGVGESTEHYNAKMKIAHDKKYFDTIFKKEVFFDNVIPEEKHGDKTPDLSCYVDGELVMIIEIAKSNPKTQEDIEELKKIGVPLVEINIEDNEQCRHLILPKILASNTEKYREVLERNERVANKIRAIESVERGSIEANVQADIRRARRADFERLDNLKREIEGIENSIREYSRRNDPDYISIENEHTKIEREVKESDRRLAEYGEHIERLKSEIKQDKSKLIGLGVDIERTTRLKKAIKQIEKRIRRTRGLISWEENRSRQARTICERGF